MKSAMFFLPLIFTLVTICSKTDLYSDTSINNLSSVNKTVLLRLVNNVRKSGCNCGDTHYDPVPVVTWNNQLEAAAISHSNDMFQNKYFSHTAPDGSGADERIKTAGYNWKTYGENIAEGYKTEQDVINGWIGSPNHCKNIMSRDFKEMGVARAGNYWTQELAGK